MSRAMLGRDEVFVLWSGLLYKTNTKRENRELEDRWNLYRPKLLVHITPSLLLFSNSLQIMCRLLGRCLLARWCLLLGIIY